QQPAPARRTPGAATIRAASTSSGGYIGMVMIGAPSGAGGPVWFSSIASGRDRRAREVPGPSARRPGPRRDADAAATHGGEDAKADDRDRERSAEARVCSL